MQELSQIFRVELLKSLSFVSLLVSCYPLPLPPPGDILGVKYLYSDTYRQYVSVNYS
jgi:hypothetical protein